MKDVVINESTFPLSNGEFGKIAIFMYTGDSDPRPILENAIAYYVGDSEVPYHTFIDSQLNIPWMITLISNIGDMDYSMYNGETMTQLFRNDRLNRILGEK